MSETSAAPCALTGRACAHASGIDRRTMLTQSMLAAASAALAACGLSDLPTASSSSLSSFSLKVGDVSALSSVGGVALMTKSGVPLAIVRTGDATFEALSRICPHQGSTIARLGSGFQCPRHGATFDGNGQWIGGQPTSNMRTYSAAYDAATDTLTVS